MAELVWEEIKVRDLGARHPFTRAGSFLLDLFGSRVRTYRAKVPGGWLVDSVTRNSFWDLSGTSTCFYPDPEHRWDGGSLP